MTTDAGLAEASERVVRAEVRRARHALPQRVLLLRARPVWRGPDVIDAEGQRVRVVPAVSALAVREALRARAGDEALVVLTDRDHRDLGPGILARAVQHAVVVPDRWQAVLALFDAVTLDPLLPSRDPWLADAALGLPPGVRPVPRGELTRGHALGEVLRLTTGLDPRDVDAAALLEWTTDPVGVRAFAGLPDPARDGLSAWLAEQAGAVGAAVAAAARHGRGADAIALGLVADALWGAPVGRGQDERVRRAQAQARFTERHLPGVPDPDRIAAAWGGAAVAWVARVTTDADPDAALVTLARAERLLADLDAAGFGETSAVLPAGLRARLRALAAALDALPEAPDPAGTFPVETALTDVREHAAVGRAAHADVETATMAVRLARWLATAPAPAATLAEAVAAQVAVTAWVDRARDRVWSGSHDPVVGASYGRLSQRVTAVRDGLDRAFAAALAASGASRGSGVPGVEDVLGSVVAPLLRRDRRVLLVVVDGMPASVAAGLAREVREARFVELVPAPGSGRLAVLAALPSVTAASRTSLLTGRLAVGTQADEKRDLPAAVGHGSVVFHKAELVAGPGLALAPEVAAAVADASRPVVAVVLNQLDDALKVDAGPAREWGIDALPPLRSLVGAAYAAGRTVVLTADHGHVLDRGASVRDPSGDPESARWRPDTGSVTDDEVRVAGSRVLLGGGAVVLPWRESLRYTGKQAGYHGGASPAEMVVPVRVFDPGTAGPLPGWVEAPPPEPSWWFDPLPSDVVLHARTVTTFVPADGESIFDVVRETVVTSPGDSLGARLLASPVYATQKARAGRQRDLDDRVRAVVDSLDRHGGRLHRTTLCREAGIPEHRFVPVISGIRRVVDVEGYPVLSLDVDEVTVVLDVALLVEQFGLGPA